MTAVSNPSADGAGSQLWRMLVRYRWRVALTYALLNVENIVRLAQPLLLGWAIDGLLAGTYHGLAAFAAGHLVHLVLRTIRQMYDTRAFSGMIADRAGELVLVQRGRGVGVSRVAARSALSRQFAEFLERHVPLMIRSLYSIVGAVLMLAWFDAALVLYCAALLLPAAALNLYFGRRALRLSGVLHDELEREVKVVAAADDGDVREHYRRVARRQVKLSDCEALTAGLMEIFVLALMLAALVRFCTGGAAAGEIFAVFRYVILFVTAIDALPLLVQQFSRLRDIGSRMA